MTYSDLVPTKSCECGANTLSRSILHHNDRDLHGSAIKNKHGQDGVHCRYSRYECGRHSQAEGQRASEHALAYLFPLPQKNMNGIPKDKRRTGISSHACEHMSKPSPASSRRASTDLNHTIRPMFPGPLQVPSNNQRTRPKHAGEDSDERQRSPQDSIMGRPSSERMNATLNDSTFRRPSSSSSTATTRPSVPPSATYTWPMPRPPMESTLQPSPRTISTIPRSASASRLPPIRLSPYDMTSDYDTESASSYSVSPMNSEARLPYPSASRAMTQLDSASTLVRPLEAVRIVRSTSADEARFLESQQREVNGPIRFSNSLRGRSTQRHAPYPSPSPPPSSKSSECDRSSTTSLDKHYAANPSDIEGGASSSSAAATRPWNDFAYGIMDENGALKWKCTWLHNDKPCGYTAKKQLVKRHIECTHLKIKSFICQECGSAFPQKSAYNTHMYGHQNLKPLACPYNCGEYFRDPARRHRHMKDEHGYVPRTSKKKFKPDVL